MKNVGIVTFHNAHNYGAMLQVYALQEEIQKLRINVKVINYENKKIVSTYKIIKPFGKNLFKSLKRFNNDIFNYEINKKRYNKFEKFMNDELNLTDKFYSIEDINKISEKFDICFTGSDQVWNPEIVGELSDIYTLNFGHKNLKRVSYAASIGDTSLIEKYKKDFKNKLYNLDIISVREKDAQEELNKIINKKIDLVLDPTLLLTKNEWEDKIKNIKKKNEKYILAYVVKADKEYLKIVNYLSMKTGLKVIHFENSNKGYNNVLESAYTEGPYEFINLIKNAEYVVATSFHATVFSIIFNKKFFIIPHRKTGARVLNLLENLKIKNRVYYTYDEFKNINYDFDSDWNKIEKDLEKLRNDSKNFLKKSLEF